MKHGQPSSGNGDRRAGRLARGKNARDPRASTLAASAAVADRSVGEPTTADGEREARGPAEADSLEGLPRELDARDERIRELLGLLHEREERIAHLSATLRRRERQMSSLREELKQNGIRVSRFREEAQAVDALREQVRVFANSRSWRFTAPLRAAGRVVRRIRHFFSAERSFFLRDGARKSRNREARAPVPPLSRLFPANQIYATRFVANEPAPMESDRASEVRALAFYLPQYHPIPENDGWWGEGFTDWHNVQKARPLFTNHAQPRIPTDLGYYDLTARETIERQASLVRSAGLEGVCIYYYWFGGKRLLDGPLELIYRNPEIDLDYCLCWANENWTRAWDGAESEILISQEYSERDDLDFIADLSRYFSDKRYIRVHGKPLLMIYRLDALPDPKASIARWRQYCLDQGIGDIFVVSAQFAEHDPLDYGADAGVEFPPHVLSSPAFNGSREVHGLSSLFDGGLHDYNEMVLGSTARPPHPRIFRAATMAWDNTARRPEGVPTIFINCTPARYERWLSRLCRQAKSREREERLVFINAWNEWAEGVYLEPDSDCGYAYLNATRRAVSRCDEIVPRIAVVLHLFYWDLVDELAEYISNVPFPFDLYVTATEGIYPQVFSYFNHRFPHVSVNVVEVENRARDIGPFLTKFTSRYYDYDLVCKVHSKKSPHAPSLAGWRGFLLDRLLGSDTQIREIVGEFDRDPELGLLYPVYLPEIRSSISWGNNRGPMSDLFSWLHIAFDPASPCVFPAGSMFWFRPKALSTLIDFGFSIEEFPEERGQTDGTLAHAIERGLLFVVEHNGYRHKAIDFLPAREAGARPGADSPRSLLARYFRRTVRSLIFATRDGDMNQNL